MVLFTMIFVMINVYTWNLSWNLMICCLYGVTKAKNNHPGLNINHLAYIDDGSIYL